MALFVKVPLGEEDKTRTGEQNCWRCVDDEVLTESSCATSDACCEAPLFREAGDAGWLGVVLPLAGRLYASVHCSGKKRFEQER